MRLMYSKIPRPKTTVRATFLCEFNCSGQSIGMGNSKMLTSTMRLKIELRGNFMFKLPQCWSACGPTSQLCFMGLQMTKKVMVHAASV
jgi:hypothetical protein